jgi:hypothetical protein
MSMIRVSSVLAVAFAMTVGAPRADAVGPRVVPCSDAIGKYLDDGVPSLAVIGVHVAVARDHGFTTFTMSDSYWEPTDDFNTVRAAQQSRFVASRVGQTAYAGGFHQMFPGNSQERADEGRLWLGRNGTVALMSITWRGPWYPQTAVCHAGRDGQLTILTHLYNDNGEADYWTFLVWPRRAK